MPANKFGTYISSYRAKRKEAVQREKEDRLDLERRMPQIVDPSFELFKRQAMQEQENHSCGSNVTSSDDWTFHTRRARTMPHSYQFEPYCEVTPKSSVSSSNSKASEDAISTDNEMTSRPTLTQRPRPRPQSSVPPLSSTSHSLSTSDLHRDSAHRSRRQSSLEQRSSSDSAVLTTHSLPTSSRQLELETSSQPYKLQASLNRPFSLSEPYDAFEEPEAEDGHGASGLATIPEDFGNLNYHDDFTKRGYVL